MKGKELQKKVKESGITIKSLSELSGIPPRTISSLYKKDDVELFYIEDLKKGLPNLAETGSLRQTDPKYESAELLKIEIQLQKEIIESQKDLIAVLKRDYEVHLKIIELKLFPEKKRPQLSKD